MSVKAILKEENSDFKKVFFSKENIEKISYIVRYRVYKNTGKKIPPLEGGQLLELMMSYYTCRSGNNMEEIHKLNSQVVNKLVINISSSVIDYDIYLDEQAENRDIDIQTPISTNVSRSTNRGQADILFGDLWKYTK